MKYKHAFWMSLATLAAPAVFAQDAAADTSMSLGQVVEYGGMLIYVLAAMSVVGLALVIYFFMSLRKTHILPSTLLRELTDQLKEGRLKSAESVCNGSGTPIAAICGAALSYVNRTEKPNPALLREIIEGEGGRQAAQIQTQTQYLLDIAVIAPMIGLLGTVMGMLKAFNTVALDLAKAKPMLLAGGVSQALVTTVAGLIVAIPAMIAYAYFRGRASKLIADLETTSTEMASLMIEERES